MVFLCNLGTVRMKLESKVLRSCGDEAIEMPGQLDEVGALFIRKDGAMIKKITQKSPAPTTNKGNSKNRRQELLHCNSVVGSG